MWVTLMFTQTQTHEHTSTPKHAHTQVRQGERKPNLMWRLILYMVWRQTNPPPPQLFSLGYGSNVYCLYWSWAPIADKVNVNREILNHMVSKKTEGERKRNLSLTCWLKMISLPTYLLKSCHLREGMERWKVRSCEAFCCVRHFGRGE